MELQTIQNKIHEIRGMKVMLDFDLAEMYGTETAQLKRAVRRNIERFPDDFMFTLTIQEFNNLKNNMVCQIGISKNNESEMENLSDRAPVLPSRNMKSCHLDVLK